MTTPEFTPEPTRLDTPDQHTLPLADTQTGVPAAGSILAQDRPPVVPEDFVRIGLGFGRRMSKRMARELPELEARYRAQLAGLLTDDEDRP